MTNLFANMFGVDQWIIILIVVLVLFGGTKIPQLMRGLGRGVGELQKGLEDGKRALHASMQDTAAQPDAPTPSPEAPVANPPAAK